MSDINTQEPALEDPPLPGDPDEGEELVELAEKEVVFPEIDYKVMELTPELATQWMTFNTDNRPCREDFVNLLAEAIKRGEWQLNGETIKFDKFGGLVDGQHRLRAIIKADQSVQVLVIFGLEPTTRHTVDVGRRRLLSDILAMKGERNTVSLAATMNKLYSWELGESAMRAPSRFQLTAAQALSWLERDPLLREANQFGTLLRNKSHGAVTASIASITYYRFYKEDPADARDFWERVASGIAMPAKHPCMQLRNIFLKQHTHNRKRAFTTYTLHALTIKAWNLYRQGDQADVLRFRAGGHSPESFPVPI